MTQQDNKKGKYLYAITENDIERSFGPVGLDGGDVYTIANGKLAAIVSDTDLKRIRPDRRHLAAHQAILKRLLNETTPLPLSFGVVADGTDEIIKILKENRSAFLRQLSRVSGKVEMGLRVTWDVPNIFEYFVNKHPELRIARDQFLGTQREPSQEDKMELGRMFDRLLNEDRELYMEKVEKAVVKVCSKLHRNSTRNECEVMNLACLVEREGIDAFEASVFEAAKLFDNNYAFDYNGPWAPHNFVNMVLKS